MTIKKLKNILLVDDDTITNFLTEELIRELKVSEKVSVAKDGQEALNYLQSVKNSEKDFPDLILLDINMPVMDGFEFLEKLERSDFNKNINVVLLTTSANHQDLDKGKLFKVVDYINKPLTEEKLMDLLERNFAIA